MIFNICINCDKSFKADRKLRKFCSLSCSAKFNNKKYHRKCSIKHCLNCSKEITSNEFYCNKLCSGVHMFNTRTVPKILVGDVHNPKTLKKYLVHCAGNMCSVCKCEPIHNGKKLVFDLDHIDGNSDNNLPTNIRLLCPNCHSQQETTTRAIKKYYKRNLLMHKRVKG